MLFKTPVPLYEWQGDPAREIMFDFDGVDRSETAHELFELELAYQRGDFHTARHKADALIASSDDDWVVLSAMATRIATAIATNHANVAYLCLPSFVHQCQEGLNSAKDPVLYGTCLMCARRVETLLMANLFHIPQIDNGVDHLPGGLKSYLGSLMAARELHRGNVGRAEGVIYAFRRIIGVNYPITRVVLSLLSSGVATASGRVEEGADEFKEAWQMAAKTGIIMPIVETSMLLSGVHRHCFPERTDMQYRRIEALAHPFFKGWYALREMCGVSSLGENMTPIEWYILRLAGMGWRNKEIASYLNISENTVKHRLTSCYQKIGISARSEIPGFMDEVRQFPRITL